MKSVLVTGGAGFLGSFLVDLLVDDGCRVVVLDNLEFQVHQGHQPSYINPGATYVWGDCSDRTLVRPILETVDAVVHLAALVGVGQSMYEIERYTHGNCDVTAVLLEEVVRARSRIRKVVVASSMSIYGEGSYVDAEGNTVYPGLRSDEQLRAGHWELLHPLNGRLLRPTPTVEDRPLCSASVYAASKRYQEELTLMVGRTYDVPTVGCRLFNAYGSRQSLTNPYTGVAAIFCSRLLQGLAPVLFEDGNQLRDFVHAADVARALQLCLDHPAADHQVFNIASGHPITVRDVARHLGDAVSGRHIEPEVRGQWRSGDIRHCIADISKARRLLGYSPQHRFEDGLGELVSWIRHQQPGADRLEAALAEGRCHGVISG